MKQLKISLIVILSGLSYSHAQQDAQYTNYMYNTQSFNPAYTGSRGTLSVFGLHRSQWVGVDGAPQTDNFSIQTPIRNSNIGLGMSLINDKIGPSDETTFSIDLSYTIKTSDKHKLAFGLKASAYLLNVDFGKLNIYNSSDPLTQYNIDNKFSPNVGIGLFYYSKKDYIGISLPNMLETKHFDKGQTSYTSNSVAAERMHFHIIAGKVFDINHDLKFKPALLSKYVNGAPLQIDLSANFMYQEKFVLGAAYRWNAAVSALVGFQVNESWFIGYSYDAEVTKMADYNSGSHEIFLRFELFNKLDKLASPRFF